MNKQISTWIGIAIVAVVGLAVAAVVWFGQKPQTQVQPVQSMAGKIPTSQNQTVTNDQAIKTDKTADWKIYTNSKYGFSFNYPKELFIYEPVGEKRVYVQSTKGVVTKDTMPSDFKIIWIAYDYNNKTEPFAFFPCNSDKKYKGTVGGVPADYCESTDSHSDAGFSLEALWSKNGIKYWATTSAEGGSKDEVELLKQILATFTFTK